MDYRLGLDIGITSVGWAVLRNDEKGNPSHIEKLGVRIFEKAENPKDGASLALPRREARSSRRRLRRRHHRIERFKYLLARNGFLDSNQILRLYENSEFDKSVYQLRYEGLFRQLTIEEFTRILLHLLKKRGYKSNSKSSEADKDTGKVLVGLSENKKLMMDQGYRTVGEMIWQDDKFRIFSGSSLNPRVLKVRNSSNDYRFTMQRDWIVNEIEILFEFQRNYDSRYATKDFENDYLAIFASQRNYDEGPGGNSPFGTSSNSSLVEQMLGKCQFEPTERRAVKASYTFEYFKLLQDINHMRIQSSSGSARGLTKEERITLLSLSEEKDNLDYKKIRKVLNLREDERFKNLHYQDTTKEKIELAERAKWKQFQSYHVIKKAFGIAALNYPDLIQEDVLNDIATILTLYKSDERRLEQLKKKGFPDEILSNLLPLSFTKTGSLSISAMKKIIPYLEDGLNYDVACSMVYGDFRSHQNSIKKTRLSLTRDVDEITNPVVKRAVSQTIKVINEIIRRYGSPQLIVVELARELSKNFEERNKVIKNQKENFEKNEKARDRILELKGTRATGLDIIKLKLWEEQDGRCMYSGDFLDIGSLFQPGYCDVDHIIPYSKSFDDSYSNKVLVKTKENREKGNQLPLEYLGQSEQKKAEFESRVYALIRNFKKRERLLKKSFTEEDEKAWKDRNLNDTSYISRVVLNLLQDHLDFKDSPFKKKPVRSVQGFITAYVRNRLGIQKIRADGDLHHAVDAAIISTISESMIQAITRFSKSYETLFTNHGEFSDPGTEASKHYTKIREDFRPKFPPPYESFVKELEIRISPNPSHSLKINPLSNYENNNELVPVFVSKMPNRKITGPAHDATIRSNKIDGYSIVKTPLTSLKLQDGEIENYYNKNSDLRTYKALVSRLLDFDNKAVLAFKEPFYKPKKDGSNGPLVHSVKTIKKSTLGVPAHGGVADNGAMVRIDIFLIPNDGYYFVPIYVADTVKDNLPNKASTIGKSYSDWKVMDERDFIFSLYPGDLIRVTGKSQLSLNPNKDNSKNLKPIKEETLLVYYRKAGISTASIFVESHDGVYEQPSLGIKTLKSLEKFSVGILGDYHLEKTPQKRLGFGSRRDHNGVLQSVHPESSQFEV